MAKKSKSEDERDSFIARMQAEKAAELQAKLAMVEMRDKPSYGRSTKKIGEMVCDTGVKTGYSTAKIAFVLRLDSKTGDFIAEHGDTWYVSKSRDALKARMDLVAKVTLDLKWTRYIEISYMAQRHKNDDDTRYWSWSDRDMGIDDKRSKHDRIFSLSLKWRVVEYSNAVELPGDPEGKRYMKRNVIDGKPSENEESERRMPDGLVPYTEEREAFLKAIVGTFKSIDSKLVELFRGKPEDIAGKLDAASGLPLLTDGAKS